MKNYNKHSLIKKNVPENIHSNAIQHTSTSYMFQMNVTCNNI